MKQASLLSERLSTYRVQTPGVKDRLIEGQIQQFGLLGLPVAHSMSPCIYEHAFDVDHLSAQYVAYEVDDGGLDLAIKALREGVLSGVNLTYPYKQKGFQAADTWSVRSQIIGACNTLVRKEDGTLYGDITDGTGLLNYIASEGHSVHDQSVCVIGAGGAATAIFVACMLEPIKRLTIMNRRSKRYDHAQQIIQRAQSVFAKDLKCQTIQLIDLEDVDVVQKQLQDADCVIQATTLGMYPNIHTMPPIHPDWLRSGTTVVDIVYHPQYTAFMKCLLARFDLHVLGGLGMLIHQAQLAYEQFVGRQFDVDDMTKWVCQHSNISR